MKCSRDFKGVAGGFRGDPYPHGTMRFHGVSKVFHEASCGFEGVSEGS